MKIFTLYLIRIIKYGFCAFAALIILSLGRICADTAEITNAEDIIYNGLTYMSESVDISECELAPKQLSSVLNRILKRNPELYYVGTSFSFTKDSKGNVISITPSYTMNAENKALADEFIEKQIRKIIFYMPNGLDELGKALYLHDYICTHFEYDDTLKSVSLYSMLKEQKGTCQGYAYLYSALLSEVGVENDFAYSDAIMHIWNLVKIDGEWYHIDVTWDDTEKIFGYAGHKSFLCSDREIEALGHTGALKFENITCDSEKYNDEYLNYINTPFAYLDGEWYTADNSPQTRGVVKYDFISRESKKVLDIVGYWEMEDNRFYANCFSSVTSLGEYIYFNYKNKLIKFDGKITEDIYTSQYGQQLCYATAFGDEIYMSALGSGELIGVKISPDGDANGDKQTNICDVIELLLSLENGTEVINEFGADVAKDEKLTIEDINALRQILLYNDD